MKPHGFRGFAWMFALAAVSLPTVPALAQPTYPTGPVKMIVPFGAGGSTDNIARTVAAKLTEALGQPVVVDNRPGGNAIIGTEAVMKATPDGQTILLTSVDHSVIPQMLPTPYDPVRDFVPIGGVSFSQLLLVVHPSMPANTLQELIALAKSKPGQLNYASSGSGGVPHLTTELFARDAGVKMQHIPYKGGGPAMIDLVGGQVQLTFAVPINAIAHVRGGRLKPIAITGSTRLAALPQVPTFTESGMPGFDVKTWFAAFAPAATPRPIVDRLSAEIVRLLTLPDVQEKLAAQGMEPFPTTSDQFAAILRADYAKYGEIIRSANIKIDR